MMSLDTTAAFDAIAAAWMEGDLAGIDDLMASDVRYHMPPIGQFDRAGLTDYIAGFRLAYPDFRVDLDETIADGDRVLWRWHCQATFSGESPAIPMVPTNERTAASGTIVAHFADGKAVEVWHHGDWLSWLKVPLG
jgi:predicted ester cyclase